MAILLTIFGIYLVGFLLNYFIGRFLFRKYGEGEYTKADVIDIFKISCLSWFGLIITIICAVTEFIEGWKESDGKPPKWM